jgi:hypothetical protein
MNLHGHATKKNGNRQQRLLMDQKAKPNFWNRHFDEKEGLVPLPKFCQR